MDPKPVLSVLKSVATEVARSYPPYVMADDVESELIVWLYKNKDSIESMIRNNLDENAWQGKLAVTARKVAITYASNEKADAEGQGREAGYQYTVAKLRDLLPDVFNYDDWQTFGQSGDGQPRGKAIVSHGNTRTAELIDIKRAVEALPEEIQYTLELFYGQGFTGAQVAAQTDTSLETTKKRIQRAVQALQKALGPKDRQAYYSRREVRSNAAWRADVSTAYEGD